MRPERGARSMKCLQENWIPARGTNPACAPSGAGEVPPCKARSGGAYNVQGRAASLASCGDAALAGAERRVSFRLAQRKNRHLIAQIKTATNTTARHTPARLVGTAGRKNGFPRRAQTREMRRHKNGDEGRAIAPLVKASAGTSSNPRAAGSWLGARNIPKWRLQSGGSIRD